MKTHKSIPRLAILCLDSDESLLDDLNKLFRKRFSSFYGGISVLQSSSVKQACSKFKRKKLVGNVEPMLVISDRRFTSPPGSSVVDNLRGNFPFMKSLFYTGGANDADIIARKETGTIDTEVAKGQVGKLLDQVTRLLESYKNDRLSVFEFREMIERCPNLLEVALWDGKKKWIPMPNIFLDLVRDAGPGCRLFEKWKDCLCTWSQNDSRARKGYGTVSLPMDHQESQSHRDKIDNLYDRIATLSSKMSEDPSSASEAEFSNVFINLRKLQEQEAGELRRCYEKSLLFPRNAGDLLLREAEELIERHANSPPTNDTVQ